MKHKLNSLFLRGLFLMGLFTSAGASAQTQHEVSMGGNAYVTHAADKARVTDNGIVNWTSPQTVISAYFYVDKPQTITLSLKGSGHATMKMTCLDTTQEVRFDNDEQVVRGDMDVCIKHAGHVKVDLQGVDCDGGRFARITDVVVKMNDGSLTCVKDFSNYWGRRGPSVHLGYQLPQGEEYEWFYNEVTVPKEGETMCSYYMVAGFAEGYFGMQFNSPTERRVLFSVWSPFDTQDPRNIPEDMRVKLLKSGKDVQIGEFGNEGSGGQSFLRYPWKAGETYSFLMHVRPDGKGNTCYTAFFKAPEEGTWRLIAKFQRPKTNTWYKHPHSFLENFNPEQGYLSRTVRFSNQWARTRNGKWVRPESAIFTHDATGGAGVRLDYAGGLTADGEALFLKMGGFFDEQVKGKERFAMPSHYGNEVPQVNFKALKKMEK